MELIKELPSEIQFNVIKFMSHPAADLMKPSIKKFKNYELSDFYKFWKCETAIKNKKEEQRCRWCMKLYIGPYNEHECYECKLRMSLDCQEKFFCDGCDGRNCYICFMRKTYGVDCRCKSCNCAIPDPEYCEYCGDCRCNT